MFPIFKFDLDNKQPFMIPFRAKRSSKKGIRCGAYPPRRKDEGKKSILSLFPFHCLRSPGEKKCSSWSDVLLIRYRGRKRNVGWEVQLNFFPTSSMTGIKLMAKEEEKLPEKDCEAPQNRKRICKKDPTRKKTHFPSIIEWCCVDRMNNISATENEIICWYTKREKTFLSDSKKNEKENFPETSFLFFFFIFYFWCWCCCFGKRENNEKRLMRVGLQMRW